MKKPEHEKVHNLLNGESTRRVLNFKSNFSHSYMFLLSQSLSCTSESYRSGLNLLWLVVKFDFLLQSRTLKSLI